MGGETQSEERSCAERTVKYKGHETRTCLVCSGDEMEANVDVVLW